MHIKLFESFDTSDTYYHGTDKQFTDFKLDNNVAHELYGKGAGDQDLGLFFTDNLTMAKWFAGITEYDDKTEKYINVPGPGRVISVKLDIKNPWILSDHVEVDEDDPGQDYFHVINKAGGGKSFREQLMNDGYDAVIVNNATTNYYEDTGMYDIVVVFDSKQIQVISRDVMN